MASNAVGLVTNEPAVFGVNNVVASNFVTLVLTAPKGTTLEVQSASSIQGPWSQLAILTPPSSPYTFVDTTTPGSPRRFYRTTTAETLGIRTFNGWFFMPPGPSRYRIDYVDTQTGYTNWQVLTNLTLPWLPYLFVDSAAPNRQTRYYRTTPLP